MKKLIITILAMGLLVVGTSQELQAQDKRTEFNLNLGTWTDSSVSYPIFTMGAGLDFHIGGHLMLSPEVQVWAPLIWIPIPGVTLNYKLNQFFIGGGFFKPMLGGGSLFLKLNAGIKTKKVKFTAFITTHSEHPFRHVYLGISYGAYF